MKTTSRDSYRDLQLVVLVCCAAVMRPQETVSDVTNSLTNQDANEFFSNKHYSDALWKVSCRVFRNDGSEEK